jgi:molybdenum cofactor synthesis domain-containing protein
MSSKLRAAIIVVSDTASKDASTDKCIPALQEVFRQDGGGRWESAQTRIVADDKAAIQEAVKAYTDGADSANLVVTSGGTGFAQKDVTPEVSSRSMQCYCDCALHESIYSNEILTRSGCQNSHTQACGGTGSRNALSLICHHSICGHGTSSCRRPTQLTYPNTAW